MTIFNLGYFQAKFLNGFQEEEQHIDCMDLAIKKCLKFLRLETTKVSIRFTVYIHAGQNAQTRAGFQVIKLLQAHHPQINEAESQRVEILSEGPIFQQNYSCTVWSE